MKLAALQTHHQRNTEKKEKNSQKQQCKKRSKETTHCYHSSLKWQLKIQEQNMWLMSDPNVIYCLINIPIYGPTIPLYSVLGQDAPAMGATTLTVLVHPLVSSVQDALILTAGLLRLNTHAYTRADMEPFCLRHWINKDAHSDDEYVQ